MKLILLLKCFHLTPASSRHSNALADIFCVCIKRNFKRWYSGKLYWNEWGFQFRRGFFCFHHKRKIHGTRIDLGLHEENVIKISLSINWSNHHMCLFVQWPEAAFSLERDHSKMTLGIRNRLQSTLLCLIEVTCLLLGRNAFLLDVFYCTLDFDL